MKSSLWVVHIKRYVRAHPTFSAAQREFLSRVIEFITPDIFQISEGSDAWKSLDSTLRKMVDDALLLFSGATVHEVFEQLGGSEPKTGAALNRDQPVQIASLGPLIPAFLSSPAIPSMPDCQCSVMSDYCHSDAQYPISDNKCEDRPGTCYWSSSGCGTLWLYACVGLCYHYEGFQLEDNDGDGFSEAQGDCADNSIFVFPGSPYWNYCLSNVDADCNYVDDAIQCGTPILVSTHDGSIALTSQADGVMFDLKGAGTKIKIPWTVADSDDAWLALDRNGNEAIDDGTELFGNVTPQPDPEPGKSCNGFSALSLYEQAENGGNGDGFISGKDTIFSSLRLWQDRNHNGISEHGELHGLSDFGIVAIDLSYQVAFKVYSAQLN